MLNLVLRRQRNLQILALGVPATFAGIVVWALSLM